jgi:hypothetical protein
MRRFKIFAKVFCFAAYVFSLVSPASAQLREINLFGGGSFTNYAPRIQSVDSFTASPSAGLFGWNASLEVKPLRHIGIVADFSGFYGTETRGLSCIDIGGTLGCGPVKQPFHLYTFLVGPQLWFRLSKFTFFGHGLIGGGYVKLAIPSVPTTVPGAGSVPGDGAFAAALGGGVDY